MDARKLTVREGLAASLVAAREVQTAIPPPEAMTWRANPVAEIEGLVGRDGKTDVFLECRTDVEGQIRRFGLAALLELKPELSRYLDLLSPEA